MNGESRAPVVARLSPCPQGNSSLATRYFTSWTPRAWGTAGLAGVELTGPLKKTLRQTPAMSLPPRHSVIWKPAKPTMWYQPFEPVPPAVSQIGTVTVISWSM